MSLRRQKKRVLITLGPTRAYLDSVRFLSNYSSGELGYEIAKEFLKKNFEVAIVAGPVALDLDSLSLKQLKKVVTVDEMLRETLEACRTFKPDFFLPAAAVLDFVPLKTQTGKVSSQKKCWKIDLVPTKKIIDEVQKKFPKIKRFGFKLEATRFPDSKIRSYAVKNMKEKKLEGLCLNFLSGMRGKKHEAFLFLGSDQFVKVSSKKAIAKKIVPFLERF